MHPHSLTMPQNNQKQPIVISDTHHAYPFTKTPRFMQPSPNCSEAFYNYQTQLSHRTAGLGYGKKTDFQKILPNNPPSNRYQIKSIFESLGSRGISFGCSRQKSPDRSYLVPQIHRNPGPGNYENQVQTRSKQEYSLRSKTIDVLSKSKTGNFTPGPGTYESLDFQSKGGRIRVSKYSDSKLGTIDSNIQRFPPMKNTPGPGEYQNEGGNIAGGKYTLSQHTDKGRRVFSREARFTGLQWRATGKSSFSKQQFGSQLGQAGSNIYQFYQ